jgi:hypothetical protein
MVGFVTEKFGNPSPLNAAPENDIEVGGDPLPNPFPDEAGKSCTVPTPEIVISSAPKFQLPVVGPKVPVNVLVWPMAELPAMTTTPAALVQYAAPCSQARPAAVKLNVAACVKVPVKTKELPAAFVAARVRVPPGRVTA